QAATPFAWTISKFPDPWVSSNFPFGPTCASFDVTPKDSVATNVSVSAALIEQNTKEALTSDKLKLCLASSDCNSNERLDLPPNVPSKLKLCTTETLHGTFNGP